MRQAIVTEEDGFRHAQGEDFLWAVIDDRPLDLKAEQVVTWIYCDLKTRCAVWLQSLLSRVHP